MKVNSWLVFLAGSTWPDITGGKRPWLRFSFLLYSAFTDLVNGWNLVSFSIHTVTPGLGLQERCKSVYATMLTSQAFFLSMYTKLLERRFQALLDTWNKDFPLELYPEQLHHRVISCARSVRWLPVIASTVLSITVGTWGLLPTIPQIREAMGGPFITVPAWFPWNPYVSPFIELTAAFHCLGGLYVMNKPISFDDAFMQLAFRLVAHAQHMRAWLPKAFRHLVVRPDGVVIAHPDAEQKVFEELSLWARHHQQLDRVAHEIQILFSPAFLLKFGLQLLNICANAFVVATTGVNRMQMTALVLRLSGLMLDLYSVCRVGDHVTYETDGITNGLLGVPWYACSKRINSMVEIILARANKPITFSAIGLFPLSTMTYRSIITTAYSYYTVLDNIK